MIALRELSDISNYAPQSGDILKLFEVMMKSSGITRQDAWLAFQQNDKSENRFRVVYKSLKDNLIDGIFTNSFKDFSNIQQAQVKIWKNLAACKILISVDKRNAAISIAKRTLTDALKNGAIDASIILSKLLERHYASIQPDTKKYYYYKDLVHSQLKLFNEETLSESAFSELAFRARKGRDIKDMEQNIKQLDKIAINNQEYKFNLFYYTTKTFWYRLTNNLKAFTETCKDAIAFFDHYPGPLPYTTKWSFYFQLIPILIGNKEFTKAEIITKKCLENPSEGSYNWHLTLQLLALLGFHSNKPQIAYEAWKKAKNTPKKFTSAIIDERWRIVFMYLMWFKKIGRISIPEEYRLGRFLNETDNAGKDKSGQNIAIIVIQFLHYLVRKDKSKYMDAAEKLNKYIPAHLKKKEHTRNRNFLRMLQKLVDADYYKVRTEARVKRYLNVIQKTPPNISLNLLESEVVPYEVLWTEVGKLLK